MNDLMNQCELKMSPVIANVGVPPGHDQNQFVSHMPSTSTAALNNVPPPVPPRINVNQGYSQQGIVPNYSYGGMGMGSYGMAGYGGYGGYGGGYGMGGMGPMGGMYGGYNRYGTGLPGHGDIESRFIQLAEEGSRPAFESIQSLVNAVGSVAMMLESTFFALTSSFRAILGVAENFGRLRSLFAQFWSTFAVVRILNQILRKLLVIIGIRTEDEFKAWAEAVAATQQSGNPSPAVPRTSSWPVLLFFGVVAAAPYFVFRMLSSVSKSIHENLYDPTTWQEPLRAIAHYAFVASSPEELSLQEKQDLKVAPQHLQPQLWNSGWLMATADGKTAGLVPVNYIKIVKPKSENSAKSTDSLNGGEIHELP